MHASVNRHFVLSIWLSTGHFLPCHCQLCKSVCVGSVVSLAWYVYFAGIVCVCAHKVVVILLLSMSQCLEQHLSRLVKIGCNHICKVIGSSLSLQPVAFLYNFDVVLLFNLYDLGLHFKGEGFVFFYLLIQDFHQIGVVQINNYACIISILKPVLVLGMFPFHDYIYI